MSDAFQSKQQADGRIDPVELAQYILIKLGGADHLKLQKLLYYVQAWHLAILEDPLFDEDFKAWVHGPVLISVWRELKDHSKLRKKVGIKNSHVSPIVSKVRRRLREDQIELVDDVLAEYGGKNGYHLECLTHAESPWKDARGGLSPDEKGSARISKVAMRKFYAARLAA